jgi:dTMP kinase
MTKGKFISFEGIDGSGKSSAIQSVNNYLKNKGINTLCLRQPGGSALGDQIRNLLKHHPEKIDNICEVLLLCTSFRACYLEKIRPAIEEGTWVLTDRYTDSTIAYQCGGLGIEQKSVENIISQTVPAFPELTLYYDIKAENAIQRVKQRGALDNFEKRGINFLEASRQKYLQLVNSNPTKYHLINTEKLNEEETARTSIEIIEKNFQIF